MSIYAVARKENSLQEPDSEFTGQFVWMTAGFPTSGTIKMVSSKARVSSSLQIFLCPHLPNGTEPRITTEQWQTWDNVWFQQHS